MKIAMIGQKGIPAVQGGVERHVHDLAVRLAKGNTVTVYARSWYTGARGTDMVEGVRRVHTPSIRTKHLDTITHVFTSTVHALFSRYDVVHYHGVGPALLAWMVRIFAPRTRVIITFHSIDRFHQKWGAFARFMLRLGERAACTWGHETITISESLCAYTKKEYHKDTICIPNGITIPENQLVDTTHLASFGLTKQKYFVMVSRLVPHKGVHLLIEAFKQLKQRHPHDADIQSLKLAIVGGGAYTDEYVRELHLSAGEINDVVFTDFQSGEVLKQLYAHSRALIHPSLNEGLPITVLEACAYGVPVLLSAIPEHREIISDERMLFSENNVEAMVQAMALFLGLSSHDHEEIGQENLAIVREKYDWDDIVGRVENVYRGAGDSVPHTVVPISV